MVSSMSDPVTNVEIEDVLSSIRRLVSTDDRPGVQAEDSAEDAPDKLVLTPALRVTGADKSADSAPEEAAEAASTQWDELPSGNGQCYRVTPSNGPDRVELWVVDGFIERLDIEHPDIRTRSKLGVGNSVAELRSQLGDRLTVESTGDGGQVATFTPSDSGDDEFRLIFELEDDAVVRYRSGRVGIVQRAAESC